MNSKLTLTLAAKLAFVSIVLGLLYPGSLNPFAPPAIPGSHDHLQAAEIIPVTGAVGPESLAFDPNGEGPYTGVADGRILKWQGGARGWTDFALTTSARKECFRPFAPELEHLCGRPLGLRFEKKTGNLYIADAYFGLQVVGPAGGLATQVVTEAEGQPLLFTNDMDVDEDEDVIYFTDTSRSFQRRNNFAPELEHLCGRPLGLRFEKKTGNLYIADAYFGLQVVGPAGGLATQVVTEAEGQPLLFTNDMDVDEDEDVIYFTDTSRSFQRRQFMASILSGDKTGRLLKYDKSSKGVTVLLKGLAFANGVALSNDTSFVLVAETTTCRILRLWLHGPNAGNVDVFAELPGFPDNVRRNSRGEFWVALHAKKGLFASWILSNSWVGKTLLKLPLSFKQLHSLLIGGKAHAAAIKLSEEGKFLEVLEDSEGNTIRFISEVEEKDGKLWIGSVLMPFLGVYNLY